MQNIIWYFFDFSFQTLVLHQTILGCHSEIRRSSLILICTLINPSKSLDQSMRVNSLKKLNQLFFLPPTLYMLLLWISDNLKHWRFSKTGNKSQRIVLGFLFTWITFTIDNNGVWALTSIHHIPYVKNIWTRHQKVFGVPPYFWTFKF